MPTLVPIDDADDPRIAAYKSVRDRDLAREDGLFLAEGEVVLRVVVERSRFRPRSVLLAAGRESKVADVLDRLPDGVPVYVAPRGVLDAIAGFPMHRGVIAAVERGALPDGDALLAPLEGRPSVVCGLVGVVNHDNVGSIFRCMAAFGADAALLDGESCDPLYRKATRVSVGASVVVPFARARDGIAMVETLERHGYACRALSPRGARDVADLDDAPRTAWILGAEGPGLPDAVLARCTTARISMAPGFDSLNVGVAAGIALASSFRRRR